MADRPGTENPGAMLLAVHDRRLTSRRRPSFERFRPSVGNVEAADHSPRLQIEDEAPQPSHKRVPFHGSIQEVPPIPQAPPLRETEYREGEGSSRRAPTVQPTRTRSPPPDHGDPFSPSGPDLPSWVTSHKRISQRASQSKGLERPPSEMEVTRQTLDWMADNLDDPRYHRDPLTRRLNDQIIETDDINAFEFPDGGIELLQPEGNKPLKDQGIVEVSSPKEKKPICLVFYYVRKGKLIWKERYIYPEERWSDKDFVTHLKREYKRSKHWWAVPMKRIKFFYFVTVIKEKRAIRVKYDEVLPYTGPKTISRLMYLLHHSENKRKWTRVLHEIANDIRTGQRKAHQRLIMVEIIETLNSKAIYFLLGAAIMTSAAAGIVYGTLRNDWPGAFTLSSLLVTCLALLLAFFSAGEYLGLDRIVDDQIDIESGKRVEVDSNGITGSILERVRRPQDKKRRRSPKFEKY